MTYLFVKLKHGLPSGPYHLVQENTGCQTKGQDQMGQENKGTRNQGTSDHRAINKTKIENRRSKGKLSIYIGIRLLNRLQ